MSKPEIGVVVSGGRCSMVIMRTQQEIQQQIDYLQEQLADAREEGLQCRTTEFPIYHALVKSLTLQIETLKWVLNPSK